jgi:preprotein translocase SecE subunit
MLVAAFAPPLQRGANGCEGLNSMANREMRRQQAQKPPVRSGRQPSLRPTAMSPSGGGGQRGASARGSVLRPNWIKDIASELRKVQWPTRQEAWNLTLVVILVSVVVGLALGGLDSGFGWFMEHTILRG